MKTVSWSAAEDATLRITKRILSDSFFCAGVKSEIQSPADGPGGAAGAPVTSSHHLGGPTDPLYVTADGNDYQQAYTSQYYAG